MIHAAPAILLLPLVGFAVLTFSGRRLGDPAAGWLATAAVAGSFVASVLVFAALVGHDSAHRSVEQVYYRWIPVGGFQVNVGVLLDPLSITMALFVTGVSTLIHLYSISYMKADPQFRKFFVYLNLFVFSMLALVLSNNFLFTFLGWEGVGTCSYLLIAFWFDRDTAASAGKKAFIVNRIGDFGFVIALFLIFSRTGTLDYRGVFSHLGGVSGGWATAVALLLLAGAVGKSAQLPLWVWLPDAMEGPTPVSALIHAATMVTAGVFLMTRASPILHLTPVSLTIIAALGAVTALVAATVACAQDDIKRVLAYSTISQLGYMFLGVGATAYGAATFHMVSHAFFKALLFLAAGSVIHALNNEQDMKRMGGLAKVLPVTAGTFAVAWLAISGIPPFCGFWSKDAILGAAYGKSPILWAIGVVTVLLTAYYMTRLMVLTFTGQARWETARPGGSPTPGHSAERPAGETQGGHGDHAGEPHEGPWIMTVPLIVLAGLSVVGGLLDLPFLNLEFLDHWLDPVVGHQTNLAYQSAGLKVGLLLATLVVALSGIALARGLWWRNWRRPELEPALLANNYYADDFYSRVFTSGGGAMSRFLAAAVDNRVIDGTVNGVAALARGGGTVLRRAQTGYVRNYALGIAAGTVVILGFMLSRAGS
ncbi:MAG TPA: NADH-quinone oxidoreductase subunit L [Acidimicrobiales bacterium]|nr:NADH-quinone oxidoreductase subunit L [Acidimicrobiales bacterium]